MKLLKITSYYSSYIEEFFAARPELATKSYAQQKAALDFDAFGWSDAWSLALAPHGFEVMEVTYNVEQMQRAWAKENSVPDAQRLDVQDIALVQIRRFQPEVLWFDDCNIDLLKRIRSEVPSIKLVLGWVGSALPPSDIWRHLDLTLSCAPESVEYLRGKGFQAEVLSHGFDPRIPGRLVARDKRIDFSFIGQLLRGSQFHLQRERILTELAAISRIEIFSPSARFGWQDDLSALWKAAVFDVRETLKKLGCSDRSLRSLPVVRNSYRFESRPQRPVNPKLKAFLKAPVYGLAMYQVVRDSKMTLNIHADSSPRFASNMRLFETTGLGTCLVTDWKENLPELFEPDAEVVVYRSAEECVEKVRWLLDHPEECEAIARAGQKRTLRDHSFTPRAGLLDQIIRKRV